MASQGVAATSRLAQMQMKFQQKQIQEREQRRVEMTGDRSVASETNIPAKNVANGKVRQMFDERRRGAGIDRSNPLKPISSSTRTSTTTTTTATATIRNSQASTVRRQPAAVSRPMQGRRTLTRSETHEQNDAVNGNMRKMPPNTYDQTDNPDEAAFSKGFSSLSLEERRTSPNEMGDSNNNMSRVQSSNSIKLKPVLTKKSPSVAAARHSASPLASASKARTTRMGVASNASRQPQTSTVKTAQRSTLGKTSVFKMNIKPPPQIVTPPPGMATCKICHRNFNEDRLAKHEQVCQKMASSRRKIFDASKHRVMGTEAEKYIKKTGRNSTTSTAKPLTPGYTSAASAVGAKLPANSGGLKKSNWRKKHEEFIAAIRAAKQVQNHLAKGGKLSDLPPPPPSENADYIQCPHCMRRFNEAAAERHIPKCATMVHNKPKPGQAATGAAKKR